MCVSLGRCPPHLPCTLQQGPCARPTGDSPSMHVHPSSSVCRLALARLACLPACLACLRPSHPCEAYLCVRCLPSGRPLGRRETQSPQIVDAVFLARTRHFRGVAGRGGAMCHGERHHERAGGRSVVVACRGGGGGAARHGGWDACWVQAAAWLSSPRCGSHGEGESAEPRVQSPEPRAQEASNRNVLPADPRCDWLEPRSALACVSVLYSSYSSTVQESQRRSKAPWCSPHRRSVASRIIQCSHSLTLPLSFASRRGPPRPRQGSHRRQKQGPAVAARARWCLLRRAKK